MLVDAQAEKAWKEPSRLRLGTDRVRALRGRTISPPRIGRRQGNVFLLSSEYARAAARRRQHDPVSRSFSELGLDIGEDGARALAGLVRVGTTPSIQNLVGYGF
jgi:hypothetical protein